MLNNSINKAFEKSSLERQISGKNQMGLLKPPIPKGSLNTL